MTTLILGVLIGAFVGICSGMFGIGGGILLIPLLISFFGLSQHEAQGTTLALFSLPIGVFAAYTYAKNGQIDLKLVAIIALGFLLGSPFGARFASHVSPEHMQRYFGIALLAFSLKLVFFR